ncbi:unnamed protein product [Symbiodinium sp. CCMP2592]|nr:unnamed protein product [Symbiodinium sp. CCMP2592]
MWFDNAKYNIRPMVVKGSVETTMLHAAASEGLPDMLHVLLTAWPAGAQARDSRGKLPLHAACGYEAGQNHCPKGSLAVVQPLLQQWPDGVKVADTDGRVPLHFAAERGDVEQVRLLLEHWPDGVKVADTDGRLPLHYAGMSGVFQLVQLLLQKWPSSEKVADLRPGYLPLHYASRGSDVELVQLLLQLWPDSVQVVGNDGWLPLHMAACCGSLELVQLLLEHWPQGFHVVTEEGETVLSLSIAGGSVQNARWIFQRSPPPSYIPNLDCVVLIELACNTTEASQSWKDAARDLKCSNTRWLTKPELQLWLDFCGGSPNFRDSSGSRLIDLLQESEAQEFLEFRGTQEDRITTTLIDWFIWVALISATSTAFAVVGLEWLTVRFMRNWGWLKEVSVPDEFEESAKLLVGQAFARRVWLLRLWRWLELLVAVVLLGPSLLLMYWVWWLPLVAFTYVVPAACRHGIRKLVQAPVLTIFAQGAAAQVIALLRTALFLGILVNVHVVSDAAVSYGYGDDFASMPSIAWMQNLINPSYEDWYRSKLRLWHESRLHDHWLFEGGSQISAATLYQSLEQVGAWLLVLYLACLLCAVMCRCVQLLLKQRAGSGATHDGLKQLAVRELLKTPKDKIQGGGLWPSVAVWLLDVGLDVNTIFTFLMAKQYVFAAVTAFVVVRSTFKQVLVLAPWNLPEAVRQSAHRGLVRKDLLDMLEEEKRSEAFLCGCITAYSAMFSVDTAVQMLVQMLSTLLSTWLFAGYAVQVCDFEMDEDAVNNSYGEAAQESVPEPTLHETAQGLPAGEMTQKDANEETWISVVATEEKEAASLEVTKDGEMLSSQRYSSCAAPKGPASKARAKKKPGSRKQKSKFSKPSPADVIGASKQAS